MTSSIEIEEKNSIMGIYRKTFLNPKQLDMSTPISKFDTSSQKVK
jgi:hypothetical protein